MASVIQPSADFTPVCTTEFCAIVLAFRSIRFLPYLNWYEWIRDYLSITIPFPIIADDGSVAARLGMIHPGKGSNTVRAVFIIDPHATISLILFYPQEIGRNIDEILRALQALRIADEHKVALPAGWPNNELIGDRVIIPPARDVTPAEERKQ